MAFQKADFILDSGIRLLSSSFMSLSWKTFWEREKAASLALARSARNLWLKMDEDEFLFLSSGLAFNILLCLLPILILFVFVLGMVFQNIDVSGPIDHLLRIAFPNQPHAPAIQRAIESVLSDIVTHRGSFGFLSVAILLGTSASLFASLRSVLHRIFQIKAQRHFILTYFVDLLLVLGMTLLILFTTSLSWIYRSLKHIPGLLSPQDWLVSGALGTIPDFAAIGIIFLLCYLLYQYVPEERIDRKSALIAACTTSLVWEISGYVFGWYLRTLTHFSKLYGAYAFIVVLLIWVFWSAVIFVVGAEVGYLAQTRNKNQKMDSMV